MKKQYEVLQWAFSFLKEHHCEENIANMLLQHLLKVNQNKFLLNMHSPLPKTITNQFEQGIKRHVETGVPIQHLIGYAYFFGRQFFVNKDVLVPRFDTEVLLEKAITEIKSRFNKKAEVVIADIGTGSGIIAISLALEFPYAKVYATDISSRAIQVAKKNAKSLEANVHFLEGNFLEPLLQKKISPHVIVSNPPYIRQSDKESLAETVKSFDPPLALYGGEDGLIAYEEILLQITKLPKMKEQIILFEIGFDQAKEVKGIVKKNISIPETSIEVIQDLSQKDRVILFENK